MPAKDLEKVYTVTGYYDGPREGIADYQSTPHFFKSEWSDSENNYADTFLLTPISQETLEMAIESWAIWCRWIKAFDEGKASLKTHPALPADRDMHEKLETVLTNQLVTDRQTAKRAIAVFETEPNAPNIFTQPCTLSVRWILLNNR